MIKYICTICGYVHEGDSPISCPQCRAPASKLKDMSQQVGPTWADEHRIGVAKGVDHEIVESLREHFRAECVEVGVYLAMGRQADREGLPEVAAAYTRIAGEKADHAARIAELLGESVSASTQKNLQVSAEAEYASCDSKKKLATHAKQLNLDAIHDAVHEMCKDEARHGCMFRGMLERYF